MSDQEFRRLDNMEFPNMMSALGILMSFDGSIILYLRDAAKRLTESQLQVVSHGLLAHFRGNNRPVIIDFTTRPPY